MANKKRKSDLPSGALSNGEMGSNYGLDGFQFFEDYNEGVLDRARLPEALGIAQLPDGIITGPRTAEETYPDEILQDDVLGDLTGYLKEASTINNLSWLQDVVQDLDRLPKSQDNRMIRELEEAWGLDRRTDGVHLIPNTERQFVQPEKRKLASADLLGIMQKAIRRAHAGEPLPAILQEVVLEAGQDIARIKTALQLMAEDHPLLGRVYVQASAFPKCHNGKLPSAVRKHAGQYVLKKDACSDCRHASKGRCGVFKKALVGEIPWDKAIEYYAPRLAAEGRKVATTQPNGKPVEPRVALANALRTSPHKEAPSQYHTFETKLVDQISMDDAKRVFASASPDQPQAPDHNARYMRELRQRVANKLLAWGKAGLLGRDTVKNLIADKAPPEQVLEKAAALIVQGKQASAYEGSGVDALKAPEVSSDFAWQFLKESDTDSTAQKLAEDKRNRVLTNVEAMRKAGLLTDKEASTLASLKTKTADEIAGYAQELVVRRSASKLEIPQAEIEKRAYQGGGEGAYPISKLTGGEALAQLQNAEDPHAWHLQKLAARDQKRLQDNLDKLVSAKLLTPKERKALLKVGSYQEAMRQAAELVAMAKTRMYEGVGQEVIRDEVAFDDAMDQLVNATETPKQAAIEDYTVRRVVKYAAEKMNEGFAGEELDSLIAARFSGDSLQKAATELQRVREAHEGLAGHLYINVGAYASPKGTSGCEQGALQHRSNGIKFAMSMPRCGSCVFRNVEGKCQKYNKFLVDQAPVEDPRAYQKEAIRMANASDAEITQSLFTPSGSNVVSEFGLGAESDLEGFEISEAPENNKLAGIVFGGWDLPED